MGGDGLVWEAGRGWLGWWLRWVGGWVQCIWKGLEFRVCFRESSNNYSKESCCYRAWSAHQIIKVLTNCFRKGLTLVQALRSRVGAKGCWRHFFKNPTTQLHVVWGLTEKKCEQTPKFACFSVQRRPLHMSQAEMLPSHAVLKEGIKWRRPPPNRKWRRA